MTAKVQKNVLPDRNQGSYYFCRFLCVCLFVWVCVAVVVWVRACLRLCVSWASFVSIVVVEGARAVVVEGRAGGGGGGGGYRGRTSKRSIWLWFSFQVVLPKVRRRREADLVKTAKKNQKNKSNQIRATDGLQLIFQSKWEVGVFVAYSFTKCLRQLGFPPYWAKKVRNEASKVSLRYSYLIYNYLRRNIRVWQERLGD